MHGWLVRAQQFRINEYLVKANLAYTRYSLTSRLVCTHQLSFPSPRPPALPTLVQYYCTIRGQYTIPLPTSCLYAIHHTILVITISCKGHAAPLSVSFSSYGSPSLSLFPVLSLHTHPHTHAHTNAHANTPIYIYI